MSVQAQVRNRASRQPPPQMFRALGLGLLVPNLSPGISQEFAIPTAAGTVDEQTQAGHYSAGRNQ